MWCGANPYIAWLGPDHHSTRVPRMYDDGVVMVTFAMDEGEKPYTPWLTWTIHGLDQIYKFRALVAHHECLELEWIYETEISIQEGQKVIGYIMRDIHDELKAYADREGFPSMNINVY